MQKADLEEKWREIQQTKLSKENQRLVGETAAQTSRSQEFAALDRINKQKEAFHTRRIEELGSVLTSLEEMVAEKGAENHALGAELEELRESVARQEAEIAQLVREEEEGRAAHRLERIMRKNRMAEQIKEQEELIDLLQLQIQAFVSKTFPTLG